jgi:hypothetical protein
MSLFCWMPTCARLACRIDVSHLLGHARVVVGDVADVPPEFQWDARDVPARQLVQRTREWHHRPLELHQLALELVDPLDVG